MWSRASVFGWACAVLLCVPAALMAQGAEGPLPRVLVIGTGGTIANTPTLPGGYRSADSLTKVIPDLARYARVDSEQFTQLTSGAMGPEQWIGLARRINRVFREQPDLAGVVVTHGTNRAEETAFFLYLTVRSEKPVVVTAAQTAPDGLSADGPVNLLSAVRVAASPDARRMGVMMVMDRRIMTAREANKVYNRVGGFEAREMGRLGLVANEVEFFYAPLRKHTYQSEFDVEQISALPLVEATMSYGGSPGIGETQAEGVVIAATALSPAEIVFYEQLRRRGVVVAQTFPSGHNISYGGGAGSNGVPPMVGAQHLHPLKARILLALALTKTKDPKEIQRIFSDY